HRAGAAHLGAAEPAECEIARGVLRDPVQRVEDAHPFAVWHPEVLIDGLTISAIGAADAQHHGFAGGKPSIALRQRVIPLDLAEAAGGLHRGVDQAHHATSRLSLVAKPGWKNGNSYGRRSKAMPLPVLRNTLAVSQASLSISGKSRRK